MMKFVEINKYNINYLSDESRLKGDADFIVFCETEDDIKDAVKEAGRIGLGITVQGARTGITGGAVPVSGVKEGMAENAAGDFCSGKNSTEGKRVLSPLKGVAVFNLGKMKQVFRIREDEKGFRIKTGPGLSLTEIEKILKGEALDISLLDNESKQNLNKIKEKKYFFPPDPTEKSASIGGIAANCASGSRSFYYGPARNFITSLEIVLADSSVLRLERDGRSRASAYSFAVSPDSGDNIIGILSPLDRPECKNAAGIFVEKDMDLMDLFIGSEGILGIISSVEFLVIPEPAFVNGLLIFPPDISTNLELAGYFKSSVFKNILSGGITAAVEYFDSNALMLVSAYTKEGLFKNLFPFSEDSRGGALYVEIHSDNSESGERILESIYTELGKREIDENAVFISDGEADLSRMKDFRHSVPESVNMTIDRIRKQGNDITKLGTDLAVPDKYFRELFDIYCSDLESSVPDLYGLETPGGLMSTGLMSAVFGHIGDSHLHVNIIPRSMDEYQKGKHLVKKWAEAAVLMGGTVSAEHGTGRLKKEYLELMYGKEGIKKIASIKSIFDPGFILNRGVMI